jgi:2'-5' RNA ligase
MRLFVSLNPDENSLKQIREVQTELKNRIMNVNKDFIHKIRWEKSDKFHITLFFIGDTDNDKYLLINEALHETESSSRIGEINFSFNTINAFPNLRYPRVLILELTNADKAVYELSDKINFSFSGMGIKSDKKFHPHITLGRVKRDCKLNLTEIKKELKFKYEFSVSDFYLMKSELKAFGSEYEIKKKYKI